MRARLAPAINGQQFELREVALSHKPDELRQGSAKATVPVLVDAEGRVIETSSGQGPEITDIAGAQNALPS